MPKSPTGRALSYLADEWDSLQIYLSDGKVLIDNNPVENAIRSFTLGRKNWLFSATPHGAKTSANLYTLIVRDIHHRHRPFMASGDGGTVGAISG